MFACHWPVAIWPMSRLVLPDSRTGVERPSTSMSFHWSKTAILQSPWGRPDSVNLPLASHLVKANSSPSASPMLTKHCVKAKLLLSPLLNSRSSGVRLMRLVVITPVTVLLHVYGVVRSEEHTSELQSR